ncbi:MAG: uroporphyrinogen-III C-methyltransferase [Candidatus Omnitrophica bacterium]|nr:uroporphyrinogen-III C-methyltransferase [Candidatus Omnitrophota bacterium]MCM8826971.1 uroporphyrinogen-III C-methyltransferase [Candidatus Omnitrophota bacterium]
MINKVYLVGAGPGSADLITVRGLEVLRQADVVIYDYLVDRRLLSKIKECAELICCDELGKRYSNGFLAHQQKINNLMVKKAKEGKKVVRLKNGDPSIFGRLSQELEALVKNKIEFEIIPGVSAANASSCLSGIPLTDRRFSSSCVFVTGHEDPTKKESLLDWPSIAKQKTIVLYMAVENLSKIVKNLIDSGKAPDMPVAIIQNVSLINQKILTGILKDIVIKAKEEKIRPPAIIIMGEVVKLQKNFNWLRKNRRILFTGLSEERYFLRGTYFHLPLIKIEPLKDYKELDNWIKKICQAHKLSTINYKPIFDWIVFTSRYGVFYFFERLIKLGFDSRKLSGIKISAIGSSTANKLKEYGILADLVPKKESSLGLLEEFKKIFRSPVKIFLPRSDIADKGLTDGLTKLGAEVLNCIAYRNVMPKDLPDLSLDSFDEIMFTSPSGVRNFVKRYGKIPSGIKISCIGEVTLNEAKRWNLLD